MNNDLIAKKARAEVMKLMGGYPDARDLIMMSTEACVMHHHQYLEPTLFLHEFVFSVMLGRLLVSFYWFRSRCHYEYND